MSTRYNKKNRNFEPRSKIISKCSTWMYNFSAYSNWLVYKSVAIVWQIFLTLNIQISKSVMKEQSSHLPSHRLHSPFVILILHFSISIPSVLCVERTSFLFCHSNLRIKLVFPTPFFPMKTSLAKWCFPRSPFCINSFFSTS